MAIMKFGESNYDDMLMEMRNKIQKVTATPSFTKKNKVTVNQVMVEANNNSGSSPIIIVKNDNSISDKKELTELQELMEVHWILMAMMEM